jgi:putative ABC transport system ATP-binding protein
MSEVQPIIRLHAVTKEYRSLRPLRIERLEIQRGQSVALLGVDQAMAEVLVDLITGATVPDTGDVSVLGQPTSAIADAEAWLRTLDQFGLLSERAVLVEQFTAEQNLTLPLSLNFDILSDAMRARVQRLGRDVGLSTVELASPIGALSSTARARVRLGRALALDPQVLLAEHPSALLSADDTPAFAADIARIVARRGLTALFLTADRAFATLVARQIFALQPATGVLKSLSGWRGWFR